MNFFLTKNGEEIYHVNDCADGMCISYELLDFLTDMNVISYGDMPTLDYIDPFKDEHICDLLMFREDIEYLYKKTINIDLCKNVSFLLQKEDLPKLLRLIDYAIEHKLSIISKGD